MSLNHALQRAVPTVTLAASAAAELGVVRRVPPPAMKLVAFFLLLFGIGLRASEPTAIGDWSAPINGLRGRLLLSEGTPFHGTRMALVYLELQNVSDVLNPFLVDFRSPKLDVVDAAGKSVPQTPSAASIVSPPPYTLLLPFDSTIRLRISVSGYFIARDAGIAIQLDSGCWVIPARSRDERFVSGSFGVSELNPRDIEARRKDSARGNRVWRGTLDLPKVSIPTSTPK